MNTNTPDDASLSEPIVEPSCQKIVLHVTQCTMPPDDRDKFLRDLATTVASEARGVIQAKSPRGEIRIVVTLE